MDWQLLLFFFTHYDGELLLIFLDSIKHFFFNIYIYRFISTFHNLMWRLPKRMKLLLFNNYSYSVKKYTNSTLYIYKICIISMMLRNCNGEITIPKHFLFFGSVWIELIFAETENWNRKYCSKIIFKCVNSIVRPIFNEKMAEKWYLWVP